MSHQESLMLAKLMDTVRKQIGVHFDVDDQDFPWSKMKRGRVN